MPRRRVVGFYTDKKNRIRPVTAPSSFKVKAPKYETREVRGPGGTVTAQRSIRAWRIDERRAAKKVVEDPFEWARSPNRMDYPGADMPREAEEAYLRERKEERSERLKRDVEGLEKDQKLLWNVAKRRLAGRGVEVEGGSISNVYDSGEDPWTGERKVTFYGNFFLRDGRIVNKIEVEKRLAGRIGARGVVYKVEI